MNNGDSRYCCTSPIIHLFALVVKFFNRACHMFLTGSRQRRAPHSPFTMSRNIKKVNTLFPKSISTSVHWNTSTSTLNNGILMPNTWFQQCALQKPVAGGADSYISYPEFDDNLNISSCLNILYHIFLHLNQLLSISSNARNVHGICEMLTEWQRLSQCGKCGVCGCGNNAVQVHLPLLVRMDE